MIQNEDQCCICAAQPLRSFLFLDEDQRTLDGKSSTLGSLTKGQVRWEDNEVFASPGGISMHAYPHSLSSFPLMN